MPCHQPLLPLLPQIPETEEDAPDLERFLQAATPVVPLDSADAGQLTMVRAGHLPRAVRGLLNSAHASPTCARRRQVQQYR